MLWCAMCIFLFLSFYNFIKGIVYIYIVFFKKFRSLFLYLQTCSSIFNFLLSDVSLLKKLISIEKKCPNLFIYTAQREFYAQLKEIQCHHFPIHLQPGFFLLIMQLFSSFVLPFWFICRINSFQNQILQNVTSI